MNTNWVQALRVQNKILSADKTQERALIVRKKTLKVYSIKFPWLNN
jgi:hypothetical protein